MNHYDEEINFYEIAIKTAIDLVEFKHFDSSKKEEFMKCLRAIKTGSIEQKKVAEKSMYNLLNDVDNSKTRFIAASTVESKLEKIESNFEKLSYEDREMIIDEIKSNPSGALGKYISEYVSYCKISEKEKQEQATSSISPSDISAEKDYSTIKYNSDFDNDIDKNEQISKMEKIIKEKLSQQYITTLDLDEEKLFSSIFHSNYDYYSVDTINQALSIKRLLNDSVIKNHIVTEEKRIMDLGILISEVFPKYLTQYSSSNDANKIMNILDVQSFMSMYDQAYSSYSKYFNSLSQNEKENIGLSIIDNPQYVEKFHIQEDAPSIVTPANLKATINEKVKEEIIEKHKSVIKDDDRLSMLSHATKMMEIEEITDLYKSIKRNIESEGFEHSHTEESFLEYQKEISEYQWLFAEVIRQRINSNDKDKNSASLTEEKIELKEKEEIAKICMGIFQEKPLDPNLSKYVNSDNEEVLKKQGEDMLAIYKSTQESSNTTMNSSNRTIKKKVFSVDRLKRTISNLFSHTKAMELVQEQSLIDQVPKGKTK